MTLNRKFAAGDRLGFLPDAMLLNPSDAIIHSEIQGQEKLIQGSELPVEGSEAYEALGLKFGPYEEGDLFRFVELPTGWTKRPTDHQMWSELVDDRGRVRGRIFSRRRTTTGVPAWPSPRAASRLCGSGTMRGPLRWWSKTLTAPSIGSRGIPRSAQQSFEGEAQRFEEAIAWVKARLPDYQNPVAYWENYRGRNPRCA